MTLPTARDAWKPLEVSPQTTSLSGEELNLLAAGELPAIVFRNAYSPADCQALLARLIEQELLYDPKLPVPEKFLEQSIPEGYYRQGVGDARTRLAADSPVQPKRRIDVGTSLGYRGSDPEDFFAHSRQTHALFRELFSGLNDPVRLLYDRLGSLAPGKQVMTAREADGREYGPAIIRAHYGGYTYKPHFDSVRLREERQQYAVYRFENQFAGVLVLQNSVAAAKTAQCILHRCLWEPEVQPHLEQDTFHEFAAAREIPCVEVALEPGDLYFFNTRLIHEVPGVAGELPRIVLATFIGYSAGDEEIFVWS